MPDLVAKLLLFTALATLSAGCAGTREATSARDYLEESTGTSISYVTEPAVFVSEQPGLAASGRDYVYLAPLKISTGGAQSCWLWLGVWSTIDRRARDEGASPLSLGVTQLVVDGEPMDLALESTDSLPGGMRRIPYATPVTPAQQFLVPVTRSQLRRLGEAHDLALVDRQDGGAPRQWSVDERGIVVLRQFAGELGALRAGAGTGGGR
jgi:hypothetical protein